MKLLKTALFLFTFTLIMAACGKEKDNQEENTVDIIRFDKQLMSVSSKEELAGLLQKNPWYTKDLYRVFPDDTAFVSHLYYIVSHPGSRAFYQEIDSTFGDLSDLKADFAKAFAHIKSIYPEFKAPKIYTTFTGLENDLYVDDSTVIIALEAFGGPKATYRPDQPNYILERYQKPYIVPAVIRLLSNSYIASTSEISMLNDMIYFGKSYAFTKEMMPDTPDSLIMGLPDSSLTGNWYAQDLIWAHFIDKKLLYEQNQKVKEKYLGERPKVPEIGSACPGRIGQWLGWRIIDKFLKENPDVTFAEMMKIKDPQEILRKSNYRGQIED